MPRSPLTIFSTGTASGQCPNVQASACDGPDVLLQLQADELGTWVACLGSYLSDISRVMWKTRKQNTSALESAMLSRTFELMEHPADLTGAEQQAHIQHARSRAMPVPEIFGTWLLELR